MEKIITSTETRVTNYGHIVVDSHPLAEVKDGAIFIDGMRVDHSEWFVTDYPGKIPLRYLFRRKDNRRLISGIDLVEGGSLWSGIKTWGHHHDSIEELLVEIEVNYGLTPEEVVLVMEEEIEV